MASFDELGRLSQGHVIHRLLVIWTEDVVFSFLRHRQQSEEVVTVFGSMTRSEHLQQLQKVPFAALLDVRSQRTKVYHGRCADLCRRRKCWIV